jgi:hypothetical protein
MARSNTAMYSIEPALPTMRNPGPQPPRWRTNMIAGPALTTLTTTATLLIAVSVALLARSSVHRADARRVIRLLRAKR